MGKRSKMKGEEGHWPLKPLEIILAWGEGIATMGEYDSNCHPPVHLHLCDQKQQPVIRAQIPDVGG